MTGNINERDRASRRGGIIARLWAALTGRVPQPEQRLHLATPPGDVRAERLWRPRFWREAAPAPAMRATGSVRLDDELELFHDSPRPIRSIAQSPAPAGAEASFGLALDVGEFAGSYLSVSLTLTRLLVEATRANQILVLQMKVVPREAGLTARLNLVQGPDRYQATRQMLEQNGTLAAEFDLTHVGVREAAVDRAWIDVFLNEPSGCSLVFDDLVVIWRRRAEF